MTKGPGSTESLGEGDIQGAGDGTGALVLGGSRMGPEWSSKGRGLHVVCTT